MTGVSDAAHARIYATPRAARPEFAFDAARLREGITLRIDGREIVADAAVWDGSVTVRFDVVDGARSVSDEVALKMAPVLTHHNLQAVETIVSTAPDAAHPGQEAFVQKLDAARVAAGIRNPLLLLNQSSDVWAQDFFEPAYASMPGPRGPVAIRVMLRSAQSTRASGRQVFEQLRGPGIDSLGNLETIPPYTSRKGVEYNAGRIVVGKHFHREPARVILDFLRAQGVQTPLMLEAGWLALGHVDEFVQFVPFTNSLGFTIAVADPASGLDILRRARDGGYGDTLAISQADSHASHRNPRMTISDALSNLTFIEANEYAQKHIEANLKILLAEIPLSGKDVIRVPSLYKDADFALPIPDGGLPAEISPLVKGERHLVAFSPFAISGVVLGDTYVCSKPWGPMINGAYAFDKEVEKAYAKAGLNVSYVDDLANHHVDGRGVHSRSNTLRDIRVVWWE
ncbi:unnamed protein product [Parascedosporium putredinis]|uniref:Protein-arginine deiminase C-terminal domain-containing protein n=1 Tax=Parascedosporium putredinis TaxID=1442378 RepID=A0A9P1H2F3_9PEZI|nr:unnamed protein product [Parascedosporium putredinis]CAI7993612.1 unnamed protein product [Parascedosporium putredinis]